MKRSALQTLLKKLNGLVSDSNDNIVEWTCDGKLLCVWLIGVMAEADHTFRELFVKHRKVTMDYTRLGVGSAFNSDIFRVQVAFDRGRTFSLIVKIPSPHVAAGGGLVMEKTTFRGHDKEVDFYELVRHLDLDSVPRCYFGRKTGQAQQAILLLEDLGADAVTPSIHQSANEAKIWNVVQKLTALQAKLAKIPPERYAHLEDYFHTLEVHTVLNPVLTQANIDFDPSLGPILDKLKPVNNARFARLACLDKPREYNAITLCHGDVWNGNMFFLKDENRPDGVSDTLRAFVDFQTVFSGNIFLDIARYVVLCAEAEVRRAVHHTIVKRYTDSLRRAYRSEGVPHDIPFTDEQAQELYDLCVVQQAIVNIMIIPYFSPNLTNTPQDVHETRLHKLHGRMKDMFEDAAELMTQYKWDKLYD